MNDIDHYFTLSKGRDKNIFTLTPNGSDIASFEAFQSVVKEIKNSERQGLLDGYSISYHPNRDMPFIDAVDQVTFIRVLD